MDLIALGGMQGDSDLLALVILLLVCHIIKVLVSGLVMMVVRHWLGLTLARGHVVMMVRVLGVAMLVHYILYYN